MPVPAGVYGQGPSCWDRIKTAFGMGLCIGLTTGAVLGAFSAFRSHLRGRELINNVSKLMLQGAGSFGVFMAVGSGLRC